MPTTNPTLSVLVIAVVNLGILKTLLKTEKENPPSPTKLSTSRIASGYRMKRVRKVMSNTMVVTSMGSAKSFFLSREAPCPLAINPPLYHGRVSNNYGIRSNKDSRKLLQNEMRMAAPATILIMTNTYVNHKKSSYLTWNLVVSPVAAPAFARASMTSWMYVLMFAVASSKS